MANPEHLAILKQGVKVWNEWRKKDISVDPELIDIDLQNADLVGALLADANLDFTNLRAVDLSKATLTNVHFAGANLNNANLKDSDLGRAYFGGANLQNAYISADLTGTEFIGTVLTGADFSGSELAATIFGYVDLSAAKGLDAVRHRGPSIIGIDTIHRSKGNIPEVFLRGCGVPEAFITYSRSLVGKPIEYYKCFVSHSAKDKRFCARLYTDLQTKGVRVWYFPEDAKWGEPVWGEIDRSINVYDKLIVVCSKNSLTSGPVLREIERALNREDKEKKSVLFPITIDNYIFEEWEHPRKADVLAKVVGTDFVGWYRGAAKYDKAFRKLLKALKAE